MIRKDEGSAPERFDAGSDAIIADRRGSRILERVLDTDAKFAGSHFE